MKLLVIGPRNTSPEKSAELFEKALTSSDLIPTEIICGNSPGIEAAAADYSRRVLGAEPTIFKGKWDDGYAAKHLRMRRMVEACDAVLVILGGRSLRDISEFERLARELGKSFIKVKM